MSNYNEVSDFATCYRMYKQLEAENQRLGSVQPQQSAGLQNPTVQAQRPPTQRLSPVRPRPQPYRQASLQNTPELLTYFRAFDEIKKKLDDIFAALNNLQNMSEKIKVTVDENMGRMHGNMERFEIIGRGVLEMALQPSNSQPPNNCSPQPRTSPNPPALSQHTSQQQSSSNPPKSYGQGPNATQPAMSFLPSSNPSQLLYGPSQGPESYSDPSFVDYSALEFEQ